MPTASLTFWLQSLLQLPHFATLLEMFVSQPVLPGVQCANPSAQLHAHDPAEHAGAPFALLHEAPHVPQLPGFVSGFVHTPAQQSELAPPHALPQTLQLKMSLCVSTHRPAQHSLPSAQAPASPAQTSAQTPDGVHS
jgi:hypothetical protein